MLLTGLRLFSGAGYYELSNSFTNGDYYLPNAIEISDLAVDFLRKCLQYDGDFRQTWENLKKHTIFSDDKF